MNLKRILIILSFSLLFLGLAACNPETLECPDGQVDIDGVCVLVTTTNTTATDTTNTKIETTTSNTTSNTTTNTTVQISKFDPEGELVTYFDGIDNMNPYSQSDENALIMFDLLTDSLYAEDYDWNLAITLGLAEAIGDFETSGAASLPYARIPAMASGEPIDVNGDGITWQISLKENLQFVDGTQIDSDTFNYSWEQLLNPDFLYENADTFVNPERLGLINAFEYYYQNSPSIDDLGYDIYSVDGIIYRRDNSYYGTIIDHPDWLLYHVAKDSPWSEEHLVGPNDALAYLENWNGYESLNSEGTTFFLTTVNGEYFTVNDETNELYAPESGWFLDGIELAVEPASVETSYAGAYPAYMDDQGNYADVDVSGIPIDGITIQNTPISWSEVGFKVIDQYTLELTLIEPKTSWEVKGEFLNGTTGIVHPANYEAGLNETEHITTYGTEENPLVSYGPFVLTEWNDEENFKFTRNESFYDSEEYLIKYINYQVISDQSVAIEEFQDGNLDFVNVSGEYYWEFANHNNLILTPNTTSFRLSFAISNDNPLLQDINFRKAMYYAMDREEFSQTVRSPSYPTQGFLGPVYLSTEFNNISYRSSLIGQTVLDEYSSDTLGYDPIEAKRLFDLAYDNLVSDGIISEGDVVSIEYTYYDVETSTGPYMWMKQQFEDIFNEGESTPIFTFDLKAVSSSALELAWDTGDFELTFGGWQGLSMDAPSFLGQVYNSNFDYMLESGFNTADAQIAIELPQTKSALLSWIAEISAKASPTSVDLENKADWEAVLDNFEGDTLNTTFNELYEYAYNEFNLYYEGKAEEFDSITASLETVLLNQMIAIPLFTTVTAFVYSERVVYEANDYNTWMGWGGLKYMYIINPELLN